MINKKIVIMFLFVSLLFAHHVIAQEQTALVTDQIYKDMAELKYPQVSEMNNSDFEKQINQTFQRYIEESYQELISNQKQAEEGHYNFEYQTDFQVKYNQSSLLSILTSNYMYTGGAHGNTKVESFNFDEAQEKRIYLTDILKNEQQLKAVSDYVWEYAIKRPDIFYPDLKREDVQLSKDTAFYFTDNGITLVFQQYEIAPYVSGNQEIVIPKDLYQQPSQS